MGEQSGRIISTRARIDHMIFNGVVLLFVKFLWALFRNLKPVVETSFGMFCIWDKQNENKNNV